MNVIYYSESYIVKRSAFTQGRGKIKQELFRETENMRGFISMDKGVVQIVLEGAVYRKDNEEESK